jgi:hypothetical protein
MTEVSTVSILGHLEKGQFYVYINYHERTGSPIYVGKGKGVRYRPQEHRENIRWRNYLKKYGHKRTHTHVFPCDSEDLAFKWEEELIYMFRCDGVDLFNKTDGGRGSSGVTFIHTEAAKRSMSKSRKGKKHSLQHCIAISESQKGKPRNPLSIEKMTATRKHQCSLLSFEQKEHRNIIISEGVTQWWSTAPEDKLHERNLNVSKGLRSRSPEEKALAGAKGWETRRANNVLKRKKLT